MKSSIYTKYGSPQVLSVLDVDMPVYASSEILIKVKATTVNRSDCAMLTAKPWIMRFFTGIMSPKNPVLGTDFAGEVIEIGAKVSQFNVGDQVFGFHDMGLSSHAEYLSISEGSAIVLMPSDCTYGQAVGLCEGAHYAYNGLNKLVIEKGQKVLVNGGTGAIGSAMIQMLKAMGAIVTTTARTEHLGMVKRIGADRVLDYTQVEFEELNDQFDIVFDAVGKSTFGRCKKILTRKGIYISTELGPGLQNIFYALVTPLLGGRKVIFPIPKDIKKSLIYAKKLFESKLFDPLLDREYFLSEIDDAFDYVLTGQKVGNVIVKY